MQRDRMDQRFQPDERGATAMMFALCMLPLSASIGVAVDGVRWFQARQTTAAAVDAAVLAGARKMQTDPSDDAGAINVAMQYYRAGMTGRAPLLNDTISFKVVDNRSAMTTDGAAALKTTFLSVVGISEMPVYSPARAAKAMFLGGQNAGSNLEVSLVLDLTGSMCDGGVEPCTSGTKLQGLRDAAKDLVDIVVTDNQSVTKSRVALVPFSERIRIAEGGDDARLMTTLTNLPLTWSGYMQDCLSWSGSGGGETASSWTCNQYSAPIYKSNWKIKPCVTERIYTNRWDEDDTMDYTDEAPGPGKWIMAHGGDRRVKFENSSDANPITSGIGATTSDPGNHWNYGDDAWCHNTPNDNVVMPLSSDKSELKSRIEGYTAHGGTAGPLAASFGWYMLSPKWSSVWPSASTPDAYSDLSARNAYGAPKLRKVAVIMTDGLFNMMRGSYMTNTAKIADHARAVCSGMKTAGIEVYTVGFALDELSGTDRTRAENMLKDCGTSVRHFYSTLTTTQLKEAFRDIALKVTPIRLTQ